jgi:hypothetical protein
MAHEESDPPIVHYAWAAAIRGRVQSGQVGKVSTSGQENVFSCLACIADTLESDGDDLHWTPEWFPIEMCPVKMASNMNFYSGFRAVYRGEKLVAVLLRRR